MSDLKKAKSALISVFDKKGLEPLVRKLDELGISIYSTGGTEAFIRDLGIPVNRVEDITSYPSILGGRVKTLHPKIFGGILNRSEEDSDRKELEQYEIPQIDIVVVDLYPFEKTLASGATEEEIIEKIDIGGISLIRAAAKNFKDVLCVPSVAEYDRFLKLISRGEGSTTLEERKAFAAKAFAVSSHYDTAILGFFNSGDQHFSLNFDQGNQLRYGENPHQKAKFYGELDAMFEKLHGKELSYNNLLDIDAAVNLMAEFREEKPTFAILKHNNACGVAQRNSLQDAYTAALAGDPGAAFRGVLISNTPIDTTTAEEIHQLFCEVVIAPGFEQEAFAILSAKKNRVLLRQKIWDMPSEQVRSCLNGLLVQEKDLKTDQAQDLRPVTRQHPTEEQVGDLLFASRICKHTKSNTIVLVRDRQLLASGTGQTSRVDALKQSISKARSFNFNLEGAAMASDAFFPFPDCVEIAGKAGITSVIQPGGSVKDQLSVDDCDQNGIAMVMTGLRHFKH